MQGGGGDGGGTGGAGGDGGGANDRAQIRALLLLPVHEPETEHVAATPPPQLAAFRPMPAETSFEPEGLRHSPFV